MADPFEVRMRFIHLLTHLSASQTASLKTASFALKHRDMDEDLHSCILESLDSTGTSMNSRANIMYFLEHFCDMAMKSGTEGHVPYVDMVKRDMIKIVHGVVTEGKKGGSGMGANIKVARKVVDNLRGKGVLDDGAVRSIEDELRRKEQERSKLLGEDGAQEEKPDSYRHEKDKRHEHRDKHNSRSKDAKSNGHRVDKRAIEQRIEEDRERNKRLRESVWAVNGDDEEELDKLWEETSDLNEDDYVIAREEAEERAQFARYHKSLLQEAGR